ncbi:hypothetical protein [Desulfotignum phosphitoxidans]|uniref:Uncharacterized protein n=1 Tax=Desulfotignum phosphitoxidans DSM 13687 TaxID=1286635 RepID=S0FUL5_9BACT|nr:hypothetical protein [Desulfotignum phosphitoxidans]EMS78405.1 hypothetical protein Dpo_8c00720 [Desulfotignum phosphitoxidans DSM 13687]
MQYAPKKQLMEAKKLECEEKIKKKFDLKQLPTVQVNLIPFAKLQDGYSYLIDWSAIKTQEHEFWSYQFNEPIDPTVTLKETYVNLHYMSNKNCNFQPYVFEVSVVINKTKISAGFNYLVSGNFKKGESFVAVLGLEIRQIFRRMGLSSLLKLYEIDCGKNINAKFIQTYIIADNPVFIGAIYPSLSYGYVFFTGDEPKDSIGADQYLDYGCVHLRRYFNDSKKSDVTLDGIKKSFISPDQNTAIQQHIITSRKRLKGSIIKKISVLKS